MCGLGWGAARSSQAGLSDPPEFCTPSAARPCALRSPVFAQCVGAGVGWCPAFPVRLFTLLTEGESGRFSEEVEVRGIPQQGGCTVHPGESRGAQARQPQDPTEPAPLVWAPRVGPRERGRSGLCLDSLCTQETRGRSHRPGRAFLGAVWGTRCV